MFIRSVKQKIDNRSDAARSAIAEAKAAAADLGLRHVIDNGEPRCLFDARGDECVVTIVNVARFADQFRTAGFMEDATLGEVAFRFAPVRMAEAAAIVGRA